jgi:hypothetical protein
MIALAMLLSRLSEILTSADKPLTCNPIGRRWTCNLPRDWDFSFVFPSWCLLLEHQHKVRSRHPYPRRNSVVLDHPEKGSNRNRINDLIDEFLTPF